MIQSFIDNLCTSTTKSLRPSTEQAASVRSRNDNQKDKKGCFCCMCPNQGQLLVGNLSLQSS